MIPFKFMIGAFALAVGVSLGCHTESDKVPPAMGDRVDPGVTMQTPAKQPAAPQGKQKPKPGVAKAAVAKADSIDGHEFPPTIPDTKSHSGDTWAKNDCLRCHETGVNGATVLVHKGMPAILKVAMCRTCHVFIPGSRPKLVAKRDKRFAKNAFPPMIPASSSHPRTWWRNDCLLCHEDGLRGAPKVIHKGMPQRLLTAKCRTCHVQVRAVAAERKTGH